MSITTHLKASLLLTALKSVPDAAQNALMEVSALKIRIKFSKNANVRFLGHLDIMRAFQRAFIRADIKMVYSEGFNPHQKMSFAQPLGVGITSTGEYIDAEIADGQNLEVVKKRLNDSCQGCFDIFSIKELPERAPNAMASVKYASYLIKFTDGFTPDVKGFMSQDQILTEKKTKSGVKEIDIKPHIFKCDLKDDGLFILVSAGSESNIKPDLFLENLMKYSNKEYSRDQVRITRTDLYSDNFVPLSNL